jgi:DNA-binding NarL/FixJ family response regulator
MEVRQGKTMLRVLVVDDNALVRESLMALLAQELPNAFFGSAGSGSEALALVQAEAWDVVILDIYMPGQNGLDALRAIKQASQALPVIMLTMYATPQYITESLDAGATGYVLKELAPEELLAAVQAAVAGQTYVSRHVRDMWEGRPLS